MAAQVLSGSGNVSYTNSTGQNVRLVINYLQVSAVSTFSIPGVSIDFGTSGGTYGKTLADRNNSGNDAQESTMAWDAEPRSKIEAIPLEVALANGGTFSINASTSTWIEGYNIIIIPEAG